MSVEWCRTMTSVRFDGLRRRSRNISNNCQLFDICGYDVGIAENSFILGCDAASFWTSRKNVVLSKRLKLHPNDKAPKSQK